jgi:hypothetical protein
MRENLRMSPGIANWRGLRSMKNPPARGNGPSRGIYRWLQSMYESLTDLFEFHIGCLRNRSTCWHFGALPVNWLRRLARSLRRLLHSRPAYRRPTSTGRWSDCRTTGHRGGLWTELLSQVRSTATAVFVTRPRAAANKGLADHVAGDSDTVEAQFSNPQSGA